MLLPKHLNQKNLTIYATQVFKSITRAYIKVEPSIILSTSTTFIKHMWGVKFITSSKSFKNDSSFNYRPKNSISIDFSSILILKSIRNELVLLMESIEMITAFLPIPSRGGIGLPQLHSTRRRRKNKIDRSMGSYIANRNC